MSAAAKAEIGPHRGFAHFLDTDARRRGSKIQNWIGEIAAFLALSVKTISTYRARLFDKMHLKTNAQLTRDGLENNLED